MRSIVVVPVVVLCALGLGGCRGADRAALPAAPATATAGDPLAGIESEVDAVERGLNSDADSDADSDAGPAPGR